MNEQQLRQKLTKMVGEYHDPEGIFKSSVDEFMHMYGLRADKARLAEYMLEIEYAPTEDELPELIDGLATAKGVLQEMESQLGILAEMKLITRITSLDSLNI